MAHRIPTVLIALLTLTAGFGASSCKGADSDAKGNNPTGEYEGDDAGECKDGADNDRDGYFDCQDNGCWGSPDCDGYVGPGTGGGPGGPGTGTGAATGTGTGTGTATGQACTDPPCDLTEMSLDVHFEFDLQGLLAGLGFCDCYMDFHSDGVYETYDASTNRVEFTGDWVRTDPGPSATTGPTGPGTATGTGTGTGAGTGTGTGAGTGTGTGAGTGTGIFEACDPLVLRPCSDFIANGIWQTDQPVFHSFIFDNSAAPNAVKDWITYEFPGAYYPSADPINAHQFYMTNLWADYDHSQASPHSTSQILESDPGGQFDVTIDWEVTFEK